MYNEESRDEDENTEFYEMEEVKEVDYGVKEVKEEIQISEKVFVIKEE